MTVHSLPDHLAAEAVDALERLRERCPAEPQGDVAHAQRLERGGIGRHVGRRPVNRRRALPSWILCGFHSKKSCTSSATAERGRVPSGRLRHAPHLGDAGAEARGRVERLGLAVVAGIPGIAEPDGTPQRGRALAADPDRRMGLLQGLGIEQHVGEAHVLAAVGGRVLGPQLAEGFEVLVGDLAAVLEGSAQAARTPPSSSRRRRRG